MNVFVTGRDRLVRTSIMVAAVAAGALAFSAAPAAAQSQEDLARIMNDIQNSANTVILGVVNRPDAPFVTGLASDTTPGECGPGLWSRGTGGTAETSGNAFNINVDYAGLQAAADFSCFDVNEAGLDYTIGVMGGFNVGTATIDEVTGPAVDFSQYYAGIYGTFSLNGLLGDLQVRADQTDFSAVDIPGLNNGVAVTSNRLGVSGSLRYAFDLGEGMQIIPVAGFDVSSTDISDLEFTTGETVAVDTLENTILYAGATLSKAFVLPDGVSALVPSLSATYYADLSPATAGIYDDTMTEEPIEFPGGDDFAEVGAGLTYARLLEGDLKQITAAGRATYRWNDSYESLGFAAQLRLQF